METNAWSLLKIPSKYFWNQYCVIITENVLTHYLGIFFEFFEIFLSMEGI